MKERDLPNILDNYCCDLIDWACEQGLTRLCRSCETSPIAAGCPTFAIRLYPLRLAPLTRTAPTHAQARVRSPGFSQVTA
jgi:hypothetical protein